MTDLDYFYVVLWIDEEGRSFAQVSRTPKIIGNVSTKYVMKKNRIRSFSSFPRRFRKLKLARNFKSKQKTNLLAGVRIVGPLNYIIMKNERYALYLLFLAVLERCRDSTCIG